MILKDKNEDTFLSSAFENSIELIGNIAEAKLDYILEDETLKNIPIVSLLVSVYKMGKSISEKIYVKKLAIFIKEINNETADEKTIQKHIKRIEKNKFGKEKEFEYILILIDKYMRYEKAEMLAHLYVSYIKNEINWNTFTEYSEILDRLFLTDLKFLCNFTNQDVISFDNKEKVVSASRLLSVGFVEQNRGLVYDKTFHSIGLDEKYNYKITDFGKTFFKILEKKIKK